MKERLITLCLALSALLLFYTLMLPKPQRPDQTPSLPRSTDTGRDGLTALWRWLDTEHLAVSSLRRRYDQLLPAADGKIGTGNVLITVLPHRVPMHAGEAEAVRRWVAAGNTLLVLAALDDTPAWSVGFEQPLLPELTGLSGMRFSVIPPRRRTPGNPQPQQPPGQPREQQRPDQPARVQPVSDEQPAPGTPRQPPGIVLEAVGDHALLQQVRSVRAHTDLPSSRWRGEAEQTAPLILLRRQDSGTPALWLLRAGEGQVIVSSFVSPFGNADIGQRDNARLLSNILRWGLSGDGRVLLDDMHQGLTDYYDASAFFADARLHRTIGWLLLMWLVFVLGPLPLRSVYSLWKPLDEMALIDASGRFYAVTVAPLEAAHRLFENFFNQLRARLNLPQNGAPLWEWLQARSQLPSQQRMQLQALYNQVQAGRRVKLARLQTLLSEIQGKLA